LRMPMVVGMEVLGGPCGGGGGIAESALADGSMIRSNSRVTSEAGSLPLSQSVSTASSV
jgi:hypothetical protein